MMLTSGSKGFRSLLVGLGLAALLVACQSASAAASSQPAASETTPAPAVESKKYTCPMHAEVTDTKPSRCPKCGMTLVPVDKK
jgi:Heavy metal binding domain